MLFEISLYDLQHTFTRDAEQLHATLHYVAGHRYLRFTGAGWVMYSPLGEEIGYVTRI